MNFVKTNKLALSQLITDKTPGVNYKDVASFYKSVSPKNKMRLGVNFDQRSSILSKGNLDAMD